MGDKAVTTGDDQVHFRAFTRAVLADLQALEKMLDDGILEESFLRIGGEQEMFLVDSTMHPAPIAVEVMDAAKESRLTFEIGRFNLEANLTPLPFSGRCFSAMEAELNELIAVVRRSAAELDSDVLLCGILPTIQQSDLVEANLTPSPRYTELNRVLTALHGD